MVEPGETKAKAEEGRRSIQQNSTKRRIMVKTAMQQDMLT